MKTILKLSMMAVFTVISFNLLAQYCIPPFFDIYGPDPFTGITNVTLDGTPALDNTTVYDDKYYYDSTSTATTLTQGESYTITVTLYDKLGSGLNTRVWVDWNGDFDFDDVGEDVINNWNNHAQGTKTGTINVPDTATVGTTRMRVFCDMPESEGHITPEPCGYLNYPAHTVGHHGNVEDYEIVIEAAPSSINEQSGENGILIFPNPATDVINIKAKLNNTSPVKITVMNILGEVVLNYEESMTETSFSGNINLTELSPGVYFLQISNEDNSVVKKVVLE